MRLRYKISSLKFRGRLGLGFGVLLVFSTMLLVLINLHLDFKTTEKNYVFSSKISHEKARIPPTMNDPYKDLEAIFLGKSLMSPEKYEEVVKMTEVYVEDLSTLGELLGIQLNENSSNLERFQYGITNKEMYSETSDIVDKLLDDMARLPYQNVSAKSGGTQLKFTIEYSETFKALFKPQRYPRDRQVPVNHFYFFDEERHNAEIAAFHLDRLLKFRRAMPVTGRVFNISSDIAPFMDKEWKKTFFISPSNNLCFYGKCKQFCNIEHAICGDPDTIESALIAFFPMQKEAEFESLWSPWRRSYNKKKKAEFELNANYCSKVREQFPLNSGNRLLDFVDLAILDFLMGNLDRHNYGTFRIWGNDSFIIHYDHGRGFGLPFHDDVTILAPMLQCCIIRSSTLKTLLNFHNGPKKLSQAMRESMSIDPISPILWEPHLEALDRRVVIILQGVRDCLKKV